LHFAILGEKRAIWRGYLVQTQFSTMKIMIVVKDPQNKKKHWLTWFAVSSITKEYWFLR
jgi:hypothetical protein